MTPTTPRSATRITTIIRTDELLERTDGGGPAVGLGCIVDTVGESDWAKNGGSSLVPLTFR